MENYKKIFLIIVILVIGIIIVLFSLLMLRKQTVIKEENPPTLAFQATEKLSSKALFFQIEDMVKTYFNYETDNNMEKSAISPSGEIQLKNNANNVFVAKQMYVLDKINNITVFIEGLARGRNSQEECYLVMNLDYTNNTYEMIASSKQEFENAKNNNINEEYRQNNSIKVNAYNEIQQKKISDLQVIKRYFDDYKFKAINQPQEAFALLDTTYKKEKFHNNLEQYKTYIQNNLETLQDANIVKHGVKQEGEIIRYTFVDNYNHQYELKETGIYEYTITLDNHTVLSTEQQKQYAGLTNEQKATSNVEKVMKLINQKDYQTVYGYLNTEFKNKNFPTVEAFTNYMNETFFENNIVGRMSIKTEGNIYLITVPYKESLSIAAEEEEKTFIVKLGEGTNFELSFEM